MIGCDRSGDLPPTRAVRERVRSRARGRRSFGRLSVLVGLLVLAPACTDGAANPDGVCTEEARASVVVSVTDAAGLPLAGASVTWSVDGGPEQQAECADPAAPGGSCSRFVAGWERAGRITVRAAKAGHAAAQATLDVVMDDAGCHVVTQEVALALPAAPDR